jgi:hypothetical protein
VEQLAKAMKCSSPKEAIGIVGEANDKVKVRYNIGGSLVDQTVSTFPVESSQPHTRSSNRQCSWIPTLARH